eukprot:TRINITY_DN2887_c0_g1_i2.p2 TRINITY_DN2887_c0_g1~~TRINITY_DN2887_c0_g1_i2.p2  ORF type:complete len:127 (-),score=34.15 TRINITY_DN2887_c0_g1_i2:616-996(-)
MFLSHSPALLMHSYQPPSNETTHQAVQFPVPPVFIKCDSVAQNEQGEQEQTGNKDSGLWKPIHFNNITMAHPLIKDAALTPVDNWFIDWHVPVGQSYHRGIVNNITALCTISSAIGVFVWLLQKKE